MSTTQTLVEIERYFAADFVDVYAILQEAGVQPTRMDPFNLGSSEYDTQTAADAILDYIENREAEASRLSRANAEDAVRQAALDARARLTAQRLAETFREDHE